MSMRYPATPEAYLERPLGLSLWPWARGLRQTSSMAPGQIVLDSYSASEGLRDAETGTTCSWRILAKRRLWWRKWYVECW